MTMDRSRRAAATFGGVTPEIQSADPGRPGSESAPICGHCGKEPGACLGSYGDDRDVCFACETCCQHGNEDGWCIPLEDIPGWVETLDLNLTKVVEERDALKADVERLKAALREAGDIAMRWIGCDGPLAAGSDYKADGQRIDKLRKEAE